MTDIEKLYHAKSYDENVMKLCEEAGELIQAVVKDCLNQTPQNRQNVIEELVDVEICMKILFLELEITDAELTDMRHWKMERNLQRVQESCDIANYIEDCEDCGRCGAGEPDGQD